MVDLGHYEDLAHSPKDTPAHSSGCVCFKCTTLCIKKCNANNSQHSTAARSIPPKHPVKG